MLGSLVALVGLAVLGAVVLVRTAGNFVSTEDRPAAADAGQGPTGPAYNLVAVDGSMYRFGEARTTGDLAGRAGVARLVAVAGDAAGFWITTAAGRVFPVGNAPGAGSLPADATYAPVTAIGAMPDRSGYWLVGSDGGVFAFGAAPFHGSAVDVAQAPIADIASTPTGQGYWLLADDGAVYAFGGAPFLGAPAAHGISTKAVAMDVTPSGAGYVAVSEAGAVYTFGDATFHGAATGLTQGVPIVDVVLTESGDGYWLVARDGGVYAFGAAPFLGAAPALDPPPTAPIIGMVGTSG